jgi:hypothetical protein
MSRKANVPALMCWIARVAFDSTSMSEHLTFARAPARLTSGPPDNRKTRRRSVQLSVYRGQVVRMRGAHVRVADQWFDRLSDPTTAQCVSATFIPWLASSKVSESGRLFGGHHSVKRCGEHRSAHRSNPMLHVAASVESSSRRLLPCSQTTNLLSVEIVRKVCCFARLPKGERDGRESDIRSRGLPGQTRYEENCDPVPKQTKHLCARGSRQRRVLCPERTGETHRRFKKRTRGCDRDYGTQGVRLSVYIKKQLAGCFTRSPNSRHYSWRMCSLATFALKRILWISSLIPVRSDSHVFFYFLRTLARMGNRNSLFQR